MKNKTPTNKIFTFSENQQRGRLEIDVTSSSDDENELEKTTTEVRKMPSCTNSSSKQLLTSTKNGGRRSSRDLSSGFKSKLIAFNNRMDGMSAHSSSKFSHGNGPIYENLMPTDIDFFESEVKAYMNNLEISLANKRAEITKTDPYEEMAEVFVEVQLMETEFKKTLDMCQALVKYSREQHETNLRVQQELDEVK